MSRSDGARLGWRALLSCAVSASVAAAAVPSLAEGGAPTGSAQVQCSAPAWSSSATYNQGAVVSHGGHEWRANHFLWPGVEPGVSEAPPWWVPWADLGACTPGTTTTTVPPSTTSTTTPGSTTTTTVPPGESVEEHFLATGPAEVTTESVTDGSAASYTLVYPTNLASDGVDNPILTYGNGTFGTCLGPTGSGSSAVLTHLASWGFVVVCPDSGWTGGGAEILAGAQYLIAQDGNSTGVFYQQLDTTKVGAVGHSQGASGAVNATIQSNGVISSTVALALVDPGWHLGWPLPDFSQVSDPLFFVSGTTDGFTSEAQQQAYYDQVPGPAAKAALVGQDHAGMFEANLGYTTAWFKHTLEGDQFARAAFVGNPPEVASNPAWTNWAAKNLP
jgi:hypothetical protein